MTTESIIDLIRAERERQVIDGDWIPEDDKGIAFSVAIRGPGKVLQFSTSRWWSPESHRENLIRAGALIVAELERLERLEDKS